MSSIVVENVDADVDQVKYRVTIYDGGSPEYNSTFYIKFPEAVPGMDVSAFLVLADTFAETVRSAIDGTWSSGAVTLSRSFVPSDGTDVGLTDITP